MDGYATSEDAAPTFCIGHHETNRSLTVTPQVVRAVHESNVSCFCSDPPQTLLIANLDHLV